MKLLSRIENFFGKTGIHVHVFFWGQGSRGHVEMPTSVYVCFLYGALMLLIFCGDWGRGLGYQIEENFWEAKF